MILSIGEALIDLKDNKEFIGGGPLNVALAASRLGSSVSFICGISSDDYGKKILEFLIDNCIMFDSSFCSRPEPTATAGVIRKDGKENYLFNWNNTAACYLDLDKLESVYSVNSDIKAVFFGSLTYSIIDNSKIILKFLNKHPEVVSFFDPNVRTNAISDFESYKTSVIDACKISDIVKLSDDDLKILNIDEKELFVLCKHHLIITKGKDGATWYSKDLDSKGITVDGISVPVLDTIGCGDTFSGAVLHWLDCNNKIDKILNLNESDIYQALFFAVSASALNATKEGCNPPRMEDLQ